MNNKGFLFVVDGRRYASEAAWAVSRLREVSILPICIISDRVYLELEHVRSFDNLSVVVLESISRTKFLSKITGMMNTPFNETFYMDTDTYVCMNIDHVFRVLEKFDIAMTIEPSINTSSYPVTDGFLSLIPEYNTGVVAFKKNNKVERLFELWMSNLISKKYSDDYFDMPQLRHTIVNLDFELNFGVLADSYNIHGLRSYLILHGPVYIIHERLGTYWNSWSERMLNNSDMDKISRKINSDYGKRIFIPYFNICVRTSRISISVLLVRLKQKLGFAKISKRNSV
jgi:hypothetical protein